MNKRSKLYELLEIIVYTVIPFLLPCIFDINDKFISFAAQWWIFGICFVLDLIGLIFFRLQDRQNETYANENAAIRYAYSNVYETNTMRRDHFIEKSYDSNYKIAKDTLPYNVHVYIKEVCKSFADTIAHITKIKKENISVSFIYKYSYEQAKLEDVSWKWISGRELTMVSKLNDYVERNDTVYHYLLSTNTTAVFCNDKREWADKGLYYMSSRDNRHNRRGSFFATKIAFSNNGKLFSEGILMVSAYGKKFIDANDPRSVNDLKKLIVDDIFPCYQRMLEIELGVLYFRHEKI